MSRPRCRLPRRRPGTAGAPRGETARWVRRSIRRVLCGGGVLLALLGPWGVSAGAGPARKVIVLGFDGLDYEFVGRLMAQGRLPSFSRLAEEGTFAPLGTSIPPQSPVAWSNFITGMGAGGHGIFDFIHRDPETMIPYLSTSRAEGSERSLKLGQWKFPLKAGEVKLLRHGKAFWEVLEDHGIKTTILRMPANFPPSGTATRELSGMGTPDILGTYGTFSFYTTDRSPFAGKKISGGKVYDVRVRGGVVQTFLHGPTNPFRREKEKVTTEFTVYVDPVEPYARIVVGGEERILREGEWSDWVPVEFDFVPTWWGFLVPGSKLPAMCRFYLKQVRPEFMLYVSPINYDPMNPAVPISTPESYAKELAKATGRFYTQGMPEDTKALTEGVLTVEEYLAQARIAGDELLRQYEYVLKKFDEGLLFYYTGNQDQIGHMIWGRMDPEHPAYDPAVDPAYADVIPGVIERLDQLVGLTMDHLDENTTLIVMSDHGFASWRRAMHLNSWLRREGYLALKDPTLREDPGLFMNVDWSRTRAYGLGLNGLYVNLRGRERWGVVDPSERRGLIEEIARRLLEVVDPATGRRAVTKVYLCEDTFRGGDYLDVGPDMIVGYAKGMRCSNQSALGEVPPEVFVDNTDEWSGDHCMDHETVPGLLLTNRPLRKPAPRLENLAAAILAEFGVGGFAGDAQAQGVESLGYIAARE